MSIAGWNTYLTDYAAGGQPWNSTGPGESSLGTGGYNAEMFLPSHVEQEGNGATIAATPSASEPGYSWTSGVLSSYGHLSFFGGYLQITATLSSTSSGSWPAMWLLPGPSDPADNEIDIFEGGLSLGDNPNVNFSGFVHAGGQMAGQTIPVPTDLASGAHVYGIAWVPGQSVTWYLDGKKVEEVTSRQIAIPDDPMALVLDLQMATSAASGWHTVAAGVAPAWMHVLSIEYSSSVSAAP